LELPNSLRNLHLRSASHFLEKSRFSIRTIFFSLLINFFERRRRRTEVIRYHVIIHRSDHVEVALETRLNVGQVDGDLRTSIGSRLFVVEAERVRDFVRHDSQLKCATLGL
jgi:hypothetical protein